MGSERTVLGIRKLAVDLTDLELLRFGSALAQAHEDLANLQAEQEAVKRDWKAKQAALEASIGRLSGIIRGREEYRDVPIRTVFRWPNVVVFREDTGGLIEDRAMTEHERQQELDFEEDAPGKGA